MLQLPYGPQENPLPLPPWKLLRRKRNPYEIITQERENPSLQSRKATKPRNSNQQNPLPLPPWMPKMPKNFVTFF